MTECVYLCTYSIRLLPSFDLVCIEFVASLMIRIPQRHMLWCAQVTGDGVSTNHAQLEHVHHVHTINNTYNHVHVEYVHVHVY